MEKKEINTMISQFEALANNKESGLEGIAAILQSDDKQFDIMVPLILDAYKKEMADPKNSVVIAQAMTASNLNGEDLDALMDVIDSADLDLTPKKRSFLKELIAIIRNSMEEANIISKRLVRIPYEIIRDNVKEPTYSTDGAAAMDLYSPAEYIIKPGESIMIPTGLKMEIPNGYAILIQPRSGLSKKTKLRICNTPGLIDSDYRGEIGVLIENIDAPIRSVTPNSDGSIDCMQNFEFGQSYTIGAGERFAQMRLVTVPRIGLYEVEHVNETSRGDGGFGSTGKF